MLALRLSLLFVLFVLFSAATSLVSCTKHGASAVVSTKTEHVALTLVRPLPASVWVQHRIDAHSRVVNIFLIHDNQPKPLVILLQGSGCTPLFTVDEDGTFHGTSMFEDYVAQKSNDFHFALLEKQGVEELQFTAGMSFQQKVAAFTETGNMQHCSPEYFINETKNVRADDVMSLVQALNGATWVKQIFIVGQSEGSEVVTGVLRRDSHSSVVKAAALLSSAGSNFFYGGYVSEGPNNRTTFQSAFNRIQLLQHASDDFMYEGHAERRWKSYTLDTTPLEDVHESVAPLYVAHGGREPDILNSDLFVLEALRQQPTRPLRYVIVEGANHGWEGRDGRSHVSQILDDFLRWAQSSEHTTGVEVLQ